MQARLLLEDGTAFGSTSAAMGEVVFYTGMTGYQEMLSDPSNYGQIVAMTYPLIGNYGINRDDFESIRPYIQGIVVRKHEEMPSNWRAQYSLDQLLKEYDIPGISDIDTRMLTRILRQRGTMKGIITTSNEPIEALKERLVAFHLPEDHVARVSTKEKYIVPGDKHRIVLIDYGAKRGILNGLLKRGCDVVVVPYDTAADDIRKLHPDGIMLSNGPGNPKHLPQAIETIRQLIGEIPICGVCLGHQLFALACGADTEKMKFGHRGNNHPVKDLASGHCFITSQSHGYAVTESSIAGTDLEITHVNNNDQSIEGLKHKHAPAISVQYHPEAVISPGNPSNLFDEFLDMIDEYKNRNPQKPRQVQLAEAWEGEMHHA